MPVPALMVRLLVSPVVAKMPAVPPLIVTSALPLDVSIDTFSPTSSASLMTTSVAETMLALSSVVAPEPVISRPMPLAVEPVEVEAVAVDQEGGRGSGFLDTPPMTPTGLGAQKIFGKGVSSSQEAAEELSTN